MAVYFCSPSQEEGIFYFPKLEMHLNVTSILMLLHLLNFPFPVLCVSSSAIRVQGSGFAASKGEVPHFTSTEKKGK